MLTTIMQSWKREGQKYPARMIYWIFHTRQVAIANAYVAIIEETFHFFMSEAMTKKGVDASLVKSIANKKVMVDLMANASLIIACDMWGEFFSV